MDNVLLACLLVRWLACLLACLLACMLAGGTRSDLIGPRFSLFLSRVESCTMSEGSGFDNPWDRPHKWFVGFGAPACTHADTDTDTDRHLRYDPSICLPGVGTPIIALCWLPESVPTPF